MPSLQFKLDPATKSLVKVTETQVSEEELQAELQTAADTAQDALNASNADLATKEEALKTAEDAVLTARVTAEDAQEAVDFSKSQLDELASVAALVKELSESTPETENADGSTPVNVTVSPEATV